MEVAIDGQFFSSMLQAVFLNLDMAGWGILEVAVHTSQSCQETLL